MRRFKIYFKLWRRSRQKGQLFAENVQRIHRDARRAAVVAAHTPREYEKKHAT